MGIFDSFKKKAKQAENQANYPMEDAAAQKQEINVFNYRPQDFQFEIQDVFALKDQGCVLIGEVMSGELAPGTKVSYLDKNGRKILNCNIEAIEQNNIKMKKASSCHMGIYGPVFALLIKDFASNAFQKGNYLFLEAEEGVEATPLQNAYEACRMTAEKKKELDELFAQGEYGKKAIYELSIQETAYLLSLARNQLAPKTGTEEGRVKQLYQIIVDKVKALDTVFLTYDKATNFPFLNNGFVDVYTKREFAEMAVLYYADQFRELEVKELPALPPDNTAMASGMETKGDIHSPAFALLYYLGMERVLLDNGLCRVALKRGDVLPSPNYTGKPIAQIPVVNPAVRFRVLDFLAEVRWKVNYEKRAAVLKAKENAMLKEISTARFLLPMKYDKNSAQRNGVSQIALKQDAVLMFAAIKNTAGDTFTPIFTDLTEFGKMYSLKEWGATVVTMQKAIQINRGKGLAINPAGENLVLNEKGMKQIEDIIAAPKEV